MVKCYVCDNIIEKEILYKEHIILNAIGGKLTSNNLLCQECAKSLDKIDAALSKSLNFIGLLLDIDRDRGKNPPIKGKITDTGEEIHITSGGKPVPIKPIIEDCLTNSSKKYLYISAKNKKQMKETLNGIKRKYPVLNFDIEEILKLAVPNHKNIKSPVIIETTFGCDECFRAICKMAINFYIYKNGNHSFVKHLIPYIKDGYSSNCVWYYYPNHALSKTDKNFIHTLFVKGKPNEKILYAYIELYSSFKLIVLLSDSYDGKFIEESYSFDVISRDTFSRELNINLSRNELLNLAKNRPAEQIDNFKYSINNLLEEIDMMTLKQNIRKIIHSYFQMIAEGDSLNQESFMRLISELAEVITKRFFISE